MEEHGSRRCLGKPRNIDIAYLLHSQSQFVVSCLHKKCRNALTNHLYFEMQQRAQEPLGPLAARVPRFRVSSFIEK